MVTIIALFAGQLAASAVQPGVADLLRDGRLCVALPGARLSAGDSITLVQVHPPQSAMVVTVERSLETCDTLERATVAGPYFLATRPSNAVSQDGPWIAIHGRPRTRERAGVISIDLGRASRNARVRSCTSGEGMHLTLWAGMPLTSPRLWSAYYYRGHDVEPSCQEPDYAR